MSIESIAGTLSIDGVSLQAIADEFGTPVFVYSWSSIRENFESIQRSVRPIQGNIYYAVKANSNLAILYRLGKLGCGFDVVSGGELERVITAEGNPQNVVFSGVGKTRSEISFAIKLGIKALSVESESELIRIVDIATSLGICPRVLLRVNPNISINTHPYITTGLRENKFGMPVHQVTRLYREYFKHDSIDLVGLSCHLGSQISSTSPYLDALKSLLEMKRNLNADGHSVDLIDLGGGFGVQYHDEQSLDVDDLVEDLQSVLSGVDIQVGFEPGRSMVANAGVLVTRVEYLKPSTDEHHKNFAVVDAGMNDLIRPSLYEAHHAIDHVSSSSSNATPGEWDVVGPICESADFLGKKRELHVEEGDLLAVRGAGAYGSVLNSNYNSRCKCAEVLVDDGKVELIRQRETFTDLIRHERIV